MRAPLSWLREFAPFDADPVELAAVLDDLGLVVEGIERVGEGLDDVVVARVEEISAIKGADRIRRVVVDAGSRSLGIVCGADNFAVGDLVPLAPVGTVLPGGFEIGRRKMRGVVSDGMLCSGRELGLSSDQAGLLLLTDLEGAEPGIELADLLDIEPDVVFDVTVEGNRPDAWSVAGVARDLAARLGLPFSLPTQAAVNEADGPRVDQLASLVLEDPDLCPRMTVRVLSSVSVGPSPRWVARRLILAGMRPINNVVDASNYVMLELGQPTHPYDLDRLAGSGLRVRRARPGEKVVTLDGVSRTLGTGEDCLICDAEGTPVGIGGIMGGESSEITGATTRVLLETAYFTPMVIARTAKRLGLRTEASARFERGCDPWGIDRAAGRFCELVGAQVAAGVLDVRGNVPRPLTLAVPLSRVNGVLGTGLSGDEVAALIEPIGFDCELAGGDLVVTVPTNRPDVRPSPHGIDDVIEEVGRTFGYSRLPRHQPSWPEPGGLTRRQRERRQVRDVMCGIGASEVWTPSFLADSDHTLMGLHGPAVVVANPLVAEEAVLRRSLLPGLLGALRYNADRRHGDIRLFEVGTVFSHPQECGGRLVRRSGTGGSAESVLPGERELVSAVFAARDDDARTAMAAWRVLAGALRLANVAVVGSDALPGLHPTRSARLGQVGAVGEVDPRVLEELGLGTRRVGWLEVDLGLLSAMPRRSEEARPVSRFPSSDVDLAFVVPDEVPADHVAGVLREAGGDLLESLSLFDVFRGGAVAAGCRSLAFRLRFCADDRTLTDMEVGRLRQRCIDAVHSAVGAVLR